MAKKEEAIRQRNASNKATKSTQKIEEKADAIRRRRRQSRDEFHLLTNIGKHRLWLRSVVIMSVMTLVYFYSKYRTRDVNFALVKDNLNLRVQQFTCSDSYQEEISYYPKCIPHTCGRFVTDKLVDPMEAAVLHNLADKVMSVSGYVGGASIFDIQTGALSYGNKVLNIYNVSVLGQEVRDQHIQIYKLIKGKIQKLIADQYGLIPSDIYLTHPTFFSRLTNETAKTVHDEYWHIHVDKLSYVSFHYTSILYLSNYNSDFTGGRFMFLDGMENNKSNSIIEPKKARLLAFTSGSENTHFVEKILSGVRYALTISFTCNPKQRIPDPMIPKKSQKEQKKKN